MTTNDLWLALEAVLVAKGASPAWLAYALPDLHIAAKQYAFSQYSAGHKDAREGVELPNPQPDGKAEEPDNTAWKQYAADFSQMTDAEIEEETNTCSNVVDEAESWLEAVVSWKAAGKPRDA